MELPGRHAIRRTAPKYYFAEDETSLVLQPKQYTASPPYPCWAARLLSHLGYLSDTCLLLPGLCAGRGIGGFAVCEWLMLLSETDEPGRDGRGTMEQQAVLPSC